MLKCELAALCAWGRWLVSLGPGSQPLETCPFGHAYIFSSVCMIRLTSPASLNSVYLFHIRSLSIALWRQRCDKDGEVGGAVCSYNLTQYPCSLCTVWLYVWGPMCRNSSLRSLEVGMTGGVKTESRLHLFLIRYLTNCLFLAITYCLSSDMQGLQY